MSSCRAVFTGTKMVSCMMNITDVKCLNFDLYQKRALGWQGSRLAVDKTASRRPGCSVVICVTSFKCVVNYALAAGRT